MKLTQLYTIKIKSVKGRVSTEIGFAGKRPSLADVHNATQGMIIDLEKELDAIVEDLDADDFDGYHTDNLNEELRDLRTMSQIIAHANIDGFHAADLIDVVVAGVKIGEIHVSSQPIYQLS